MDTQSVSTPAIVPVTPSNLEPQDRCGLVLPWEDGLLLIQHPGGELNLPGDLKREPPDTCRYTALVRYMREVFNYELKPFTVKTLGVSTSLGWVGTKFYEWQDHPFKPGHKLNCVGELVAASQRNHNYVGPVVLPWAINPGE